MGRTVHMFPSPGDDPKWYKWILPAVLAICLVLVIMHAIKSNLI